MTFSLIICTYMRTQPLLNLLNSVNEQTLYPNEIIIVDGSANNDTKQQFNANPYKNLKYFKVEDNQRGLTKQRNFGIQKVSNASEIICFLDDDAVLENDYFEQLLKVYKVYPNALGVGGYITNEVIWKKSERPTSKKNFFYDGWERNEPLRFRVRHFFGLQPNTAPCILPEFSHGRSVSFLPPTSKIYQVEQFMGGVSSFKKDVFNTMSFSTYFEGYGLYEDADFTLRLSKKGELYVNTAARLSHYHDESGRPNKFKYGKMVARNGWYVWRVKYSNPSFKSKLKWNLTFIVLMKLRFLNVLTSKNKMEALTEGFGRFFGWLSLIFNKPKIER
ncbi:glycosyltransferase family 2 protein [Pontimicrobium aquaticum]|uniref:Glycosyltransferase family 2 protein n=1 Tax=Pontimicrobium aquaticum TaxID=2565367 RepID=A0A4U0EN95_9FLAO|nr:glycosyltransferase [Pontimicrobium aquaticum]TJY32908.1 glycosyltransferase family 2 protein [Pontimicrobium aquaticum]